jgi:thymidylate synthase (FAD)
VVEIILTSEITVEEVQQCGNDDMIAHAAMVSTRGKRREAITPAKRDALLNVLLEKSHGSPFECGLLTVFIHAPIKVFREWHRHRVQSFSEESGRYKDLEPVFYIPPRERPAIRPEGFKSMRPAFDRATDEEYGALCMQLRHGYQEAYDRYLELLRLQVDRGLARDVLGVGIYSSMYATLNPRSIMSFLELRTTHPEAKRPSSPLYEIDVAANKVEELFKLHWPVTHALWVKHGRMAP